jgi:ribose transport system permease protein
MRFSNLQDWLPIVVLAVLIGVVSAYDPGFFTVSNLLEITANTMTLFLMAAGLTLVIMMGSIDLSVQSIASMASCILAVYMPQIGAAAIPLALLGGVAAGAFSSAISTRLRIPTFIATLAVSGIVLSVAFWISDTRSVFISGETRDAYLFWITGSTLGIPTEIWVGLVALVALSALLQLTPFGRLVRGVGAQERAVVASGIDVNRIKLYAFVLSGLMAALAGIVMATRLGSGSPTLANEFLLPAIAAVVVGGTAITGGVGSIWRTFVGALIIQVVRIGMTFMGISVFAQQIIFGALLIAAVAATIDRSKILVVK